MDIPQNSSTGLKSSWLDRSLFRSPMISFEMLIFALILVMAIFTRLYMLEPRVMSHDETSHTYFSWLFYKGEGYAHDPVTHGPLQFHLVALSYFLFGDSDTTARIPAALFGIASVAFMWVYRRYLGRAGALVAALFLTISPYILYYARYVRNESFVVLFGLMMLWSVLRYLDTGKFKYLYVFTAVTVLHFCTKETSFIYTAQALLFLALYLFYRIVRREWKNNEYRSTFIISLIISVILITSGFFLRMLAGKMTVDQQPQFPTFASLPSLLYISIIALGLIGLVIAVYFVMAGFGLKRIRQERVFDLLILLGTLVLPQLSAFGINAFGWKIPVNAAEVQALTMTDMLHMAIIVVPIILVSVILGLWWNKRQWLINAGIWYTIYIVFYTSLFSNGAGLFTGLVGSLGYWLAQQGVNRGDQPIYYYALIQIPIYEFLPAIGSILGILLAIMGRKTVPDDAFTLENPQLDEPEHIYTPILDSEFSTADGQADATALTDDPDLPIEPAQPEPETSPPIYATPPTVPLLIFWAVTALMAYTVAGEKMPWLTVHITLPMILLSGWAIGYLIDTTDWVAFRNKKGWLAIALLFVFIPAIMSTFRIWLGANPPFAGKSLEQLSATSGFIISLVVAIASGFGLGYLMKDWPPRLVRRGIGLVLFSLLAVLTARVAFMASYINYDLAKEYLVYAHCAPGDKIALQQITDISRRMTGGLDITVAYDDKTTYPYWWYLRNFKNQRYYGNAPTRDLRDVPLILVGQDNFGKIEPVVGQAYDKFEYNRIWWPNMDYFNLNKDRLLYAIFNPQMREAIFQIWLNRDYTLYGEQTGQDMSLQNWNPSEKFRLYIRKDVVAQLWDYGSTQSSTPVQADPYEGKQITVSADQVIGTAGSEPGQFQTPRDIAMAPDGTLYVADTFNNRIQHLAADGTILHEWGTFADISKGDAPGGTFFQPWGIAVGADGSVYVADTWNHRIQKFTSDGQFVNMWGYFGQADTPFAIWGPRDIAMDSAGQVYITDTGNKRIVIYDGNGTYISQFGSAGLESGQFDEPVGVAVDKNGVVYVADTWNQRIQVMSKNESGEYLSTTSWDVVAWFGQSLDNKPFLAVDNKNNLYTTDPEGYRVLHFTTGGTFINYFGDYGTGTNEFNLPTGIITDGKGGVWIADAGNNRIMHFSLPTQ
jgi:predicted membrane-bound mannosyltransferase/DNA-binding beta-propeller fold protein YncE